MGRLVPNIEPPRRETRTACQSRPIQRNQTVRKETNLSDTDLAAAILALHLVIIAFNVLGLVVIPLGAWRGWRIVRNAWLRLLHLGLLAVVVAQAVAGRACILTIWQNRLAGGGRAAPPLIMQWVDRLIYWNLPLWAFACIYAAAFLYVAALSILIPFGGRYRG